MPIPPDEQNRSAPEEHPTGTPEPGEPHIPESTRAPRRHRGGKSHVEEQERAASSEARRAGEEARVQARSMVEEQQRAAARTMSGLASAVRHASDKLEDEQHHSLARYARDAAGRLEDVAHDLKGRDLASLFDDARGFARDHPLAVLGGALAVGYVVGRMTSSIQEGRPAEEYEEPVPGEYEGQGFSTH